MVLKQREKVHVIIRRLFESDLRRHFVGEVQEANDSSARLEGYVFVFDPALQAFFKRPELRTRILSLTDAGNIINLIPPTVKLDDVSYQVTAKNHLVLTDGKSFTLDINEFSASR